MGWALRTVNFEDESGIPKAAIFLRRSTQHIGCSEDLVADLKLDAELAKLEAESLEMEAMDD